MAWAETTPDDVLNKLDGSVTIEKLSAEEDVILAGDEWPDGVVEGSIKSKATPEGLVFAAKAGSKVALRIASPDPVGPALTVLKSILSAVYTRNQAIWGIEQDLAWRWYQHPEKRGKVPVVSKNDHLFAILDTPTFTNAGSAQKQYDTWYSHAQQFYPIPMGYKLAAFDGGEWNPTGTFNIDDYQEYAKWYDYFEEPIVIPDVPEDGIPQQFKLRPVFGTAAVTSNNTIMDVSALNINVNMTEQVNTQINKLLETYPNWLAVYHTSKSYQASTMGVIIYLSTQEINYTYELGANGYYTFRINSNAQIYYLYTQQFLTSSDISITFNNTVLGSVPASNSFPRQMLITGLLDYNNDVEQEPSEPVYFEPTQDTIRPVAPTVTPDTVTYVTYNQVSNTTTTVDLQPILDAIRNLDRNVQTGFGNVISAIETCCENMRTFLNAWLTDIYNWYDLMLTELQKQTRWLEAIYYSKANDVIVQSDDESDDGVDLQIQWENNLSQLEKKFPLSIPWDLYGCLALLDAPPQAPVFELPVVMTEYTVEVDLSDFEPVASISRKLSVLLFVVGLLMNTKKLISITIGEGMPD